MVDAEWITAFVQQTVPDATVHATDLNGGGDHWHVVVIAESFEGTRSFQRQRPILAAATPHIQSGVIHAFDLKCITPAELAEKHEGNIPRPFIPHQAGTGDHPGSWD